MSTGVVDTVSPAPAPRSTGRVRAIGRPALGLAERELEAMLTLAEAPPAGEETERGDIDLLGPSVTPPTAYDPRRRVLSTGPAPRARPMARPRSSDLPALPAADAEETQHRPILDRAPASPVSAERTVARAELRRSPPRVVAPGPEYAEPLGAWLLWVTGLVVAGIGLGVLLVVLATLT